MDKGCERRLSPRRAREPRRLRAPPSRLMVDLAAEAWQKVGSCASNALHVFTVRSRPFATNVWPRRR